MARTPKARASTPSGPLRLFLIGLGADERTERMVRFLAENTGMDISLLTFHGFAYDGKTLLARQVEVEAAADHGPRRPRRYLSAEEKRDMLKRNIEDSGISETFSAVEDMFEANWPRFSRSRESGDQVSNSTDGHMHAFIGVRET